MVCPVHVELQLADNAECPSCQLTIFGRASDYAVTLQANLDAP